jgi:dUTP pyrophosphatase
LDSISYKVGDRGAQIIILPYPQVTMVETNELSDTERGVGGFGSTGS